MGDDIVDVEIIHHPDYMREHIRFLLGAGPEPEYMRIQKEMLNAMHEAEARYRNAPWWKQIWMWLCDSRWYR